LKKLHFGTSARPTAWLEADGDVLLLDDEDGNPTEIIGADIEKDDT
jgi:hypothetical protein